MILRTVFTGIYFCLRYLIKQSIPRIRNAVFPRPARKAQMEKALIATSELMRYLQFSYIFSGAETPMSFKQSAITMRTVSASLSRAYNTPSASPLMRQEL